MACGQGEAEGGGAEPVQEGGAGAALLRYIARMTADALQYVTTALAAVGAVLGVLNFWRAWERDRVRIKVNVSAGMDAAGNDHLLLVDVRNLSSFPITVTHIGFDQIDPARRHLQIPRPIFAGSEKALPIRLESRASLTAVIDLQANPHVAPERLLSAYVNTACGLKVSGGGRALDALRVTFAQQ